LVGDLESQVTKELHVDPRVHPRIIGGRGKGVAKIMDEFKVSVKFPKSGDKNPSLVVITGNDEGVELAADYILNLEEEYVEDLNDQYLPPRSHGGADGGGAPRGAKGGFQVKGGPWEPGSQMAPDTNDTEAFPSMGINANSGDSHGTPWGPRYGNSK